MGLRDYIRKRSFKRTPEPKGKSAPRGKHRLRFVVQEHHASTLHYDFRLELGGVLKSWAVPKGPSMNPHDHHLAIQTEDHPYDYRSFEGVIPEGNYGAGNVIIWDEGWYEPRADDGSEKSLLGDLKRGHVTFILHGTKLRGEFALIRMPHAKEDNAWLLIKKTDSYATERDVTRQDESVKSHRHVDDLGAHGKLPDLTNFPKAGRPWTVKPMLCTLVDEPFDRDGWLFEIKWDGYRAIGSKHKDSVRLYSRNQNDFAAAYPPVVEALRELPHDVILDGEIVVVDQDGHSHFEWLQNWHRQPQGTLQYHLFDILWCDGHDIRTMPLRARKALLHAILPAKGLLRFSDDVEHSGLKLFAEMQRRGLEGMVAKRADSSYSEDVRGQDWLKVKTHLRQEVVIGGYTEPRGGRKYLGSLLVGTYEKGQFVYRGHSGGGIPDGQRQSLQNQLSKLERKTSPFALEPKPNAPVHWVRPELVCEMEFGEWTSEGYMRQPEFKGLRPDKKPAEVHREKSHSSLSVEPLHNRWRVTVGGAAPNFLRAAVPASKNVEADRPAGPATADSLPSPRASSSNPTMLNEARHEEPHSDTQKETVASLTATTSSPEPSRASSSGPPQTFARGVPLDKSSGAAPPDATRHQDFGGSSTKLEATLPFEPTHLDKTFFPKHKYTKGDLLAYYASVGGYILPYLRDRPLSLNRMPDGINGPSFFQKNNEHLPDWVPHADIFSDSNNANLRWIVGGQLDTLLYVAQLGSIEINPWNARVGHLDKPDWIVIDLDPEGVSFEKVIEVARTVHDVCDQWRIPAYPKTSGKTGLHIFIPMAAKYTFEQGKNLAHLIALEVNRRQPKLTSVQRNPDKRKRKIYLDFLQNREGQTLAAAYSVRPTPDATVSMPLRWSEVKSGLKPTDFTIKNAATRLKRTGDLWESVLGKGIDLSAVLKRVEK